MKIGNIRDFVNKVNEIFINGDKYFLVKREENKYFLYDSICPHQGATLCFNREKNSISCPVHGWEFDIKSGVSVNVKNKSLNQKEIRISSDGDIYLYDSYVKEKSIKNNIFLQNDFQIHLHAHASLEFRTTDFSLLCDPWLEGNAFLGAWKHYPEPVIKVEELNPDAIWISHEHSDHFHEETLKKFNKDIPVYVPAFMNGRLEKRLIELEFKNIYVVPFGQTVKIAPNFKITIYEPASIWNDAQVLIEIEGFKILNINDSGINHRIAKIIGKVDLIASAFSPGASGFPLTWKHISDLKKIEMMKISKKGTLDMLVQVTKMYSAKYFLPFASHFILGSPKHHKYMDLMQKNTLYDVVKRFQSEDCEVIDLLAGDYWDAKELQIIKLNRDYKTLYQPKTIKEYINSSFNEVEFNKYYPSKQQYKYNKEIVFSYFYNLNRIPEMYFCEDLTMNIYPDFLEDRVFSLEIRAGKLKIHEYLIENPNLTMKIPSEILMYICLNNESWDEATIGYWCEFSRNPDVYHAEFWRILQTPYYLKKPNISSEKALSYKISKENNIAETLELLGDRGSKILGRYGLYCIACNKANMESIGIACEIHGIENTQMLRMITELNIHLAEIEKQRIK